MKLYLYPFFIIFINYCYGNDNILQPTGKMNFDKIKNLNINLYESSKNPENYFIQVFQPMGVFKELRNIRTLYKKIYKKHTNFALETLDNNKKLDFGQTFTFSSLNDLCNSEFEKDNAKFCLKYHPNNWNCIYNNCISLSRTIPHYINIVLPPIYYNNETTKQCLLLS
jgi:hypothetical protein